MHTRTLTAAMALLFPLTASSFAGGDGSPGNPYQIATCQHLQSINGVSNYQTKDFVLNNDIDCTSFGSFTRIGPYEYDGEFDGAGYSIDGLDISGSSYVGLFLWLNPNAEVHDLSIINATITGTSNVSAGILSGYNWGTITNVHVSGTVSSSNSSNTGGMVGVCNNNGTLTNVSADVTVTVSGTGNSVSAGGLLGIMGECDVQYASASGNVSQTSGAPAITEIGGFAGRIAGADCTECSASGNVVGSGGTVSVGGLFGIARSSTVTSYITDSYARGTVTGPFNNVASAGGLIGSADTLVITRAYSTGVTSGPGDSGAFIGKVNNNVTFTDVFSSPAGLTSTGFGISEVHPAGSTAVYHQYFPSGHDCTSAPNPGCILSATPQSTFYSSLTAPMDQWDFVNVWEESGGDYPTLRNTGVNAGGGGGAPTCLVGSPYDWDGDLADDGCRGTNVVIGDGVLVPAGTQIGNDVTVMSSAVLGTGVVLHNGVTLAPGANIGDNTTLQGNVLVGRRADLGEGVVLLSDTTVGRNASVGDNSEVGGSIGYASQIGSNVQVEDIILGNLAILGSPTTPAGEISCPGPLVMARSSSVAANPAHSFTCSGSVVIGPGTTVEGADVESNVRIRKNAYVQSHATFGSNIRLGRDTQTSAGVELATGTAVGSTVELCDASSAFTGSIPRSFTDPACP